MKISPFLDFFLLEALAVLPSIVLISSILNNPNWYNGLLLSLNLLTASKRIFSSSFGLINDITRFIVESEGIPFSNSIYLLNQ